MGWILTELDRGGRREFLLVAGIAFLITATVALRTELITRNHPDFTKPADHHFYITMATEKPFSSRYAAFCWRVANPMMARLLPFDLELSFLTIAFTSIAFTGVVIYYIARSYGFHRAYALTGMFIFFSLGWAAKSSLKVFWLPDALSFLFITLCIYCVLTKKDVYFLVLLASGVLVKETVLFVAPLYYSLNARRTVEPKLALQSLLLLVPALVVLIAVRICIPPENAYSYWNYLLGYGLPRILNMSGEALYIYSVGTFGLAVIILPFFSPRQNLRLMLRFSPLLVMVYIQILIADRYFPGNAQRLLVVAFPAVILLALKGVEALSQRLHLNTTDFLLLPLYLLGSNLINRQSVTTNLTDQALTLSSYIALVALLRRHRWLRAKE